MCKRLVVVCFLNQLGFQAAYFVGIIGCATYALGADAVGVSVLVFVMNVVMLVGYSLAGALIDAMGPRPVLAGALAGPLAAAAVMFAAPLSMASLLAVSVVMGLSGAAASTAVETFPRYLTADEPTLVRVNSLASVATFAAVIAGPLLAGAIAGAADNRLVFAVLPLTSVPGVAVALTLRERVRPKREGSGDEPARSLFSRIADGVRACAESPALIVLFLVCFLGNLGFGAFDSLESLFYRDVLRVGAEWMGWLTAIVGVGATVGSLLAPRVPPKRVTLPVLCGLLVLEGLGAVNDEAYAGVIARHYGTLGYGPARVKQELHRRGIPKELWDGALAQLPPAQDTIRALAHAKLRGKSLETDTSRRLAAYLQRRGFSWNDIRPVLNELGQDIDEE